MKLLSITLATLVAAAIALPAPKDVSNKKTITSSGV